MSMKKILGSLLIMLLAGVCTYGQTSSLSGDKNYVVTYSPRKEGIKLPSDLSNRPANEVNQSVQYFDGLGRPMQTVETFASPGKKDIIQHIEYDAYGREVKKYLPYTEGTSYGTYRSNALSSQSSFYNNGVVNGVVEIPSVNSITPSFAETKFELSPLNRVIEQGAPGAVWQLTSGHTVKTVYGANAASEVALWTISGTTASCSNAFYGANQLYKTILKDENWTSGTSGTTEEFKDKEGRVVLKRTWESETVSLSTYYIYDDLGNLRYVVPPIPPQEAVSSFTELTTDAAFTRYIYAYHYDHRNRLIEKKIPGKDWEHIIYNKLDQVVATQDANQRVSGQWLFTKYDAFGRVVVTGLYNNSAVRSTVQSAADAVTVLWETRGNTATYSSSAFPTSGTTTLTVNYYDDYTFGPNYAFATPHSYGQQQTTRTKGLLTGSLVNTLGTSTYLQTVNYYNEDGRLIQATTAHHLGGTDRIDNKYSFTGELTASTRIHSSSAGNVTLANRYVYDHAGRKKQTFQTTGGTGNTEVKLSELEYNEIGQLREKKLHDDLQSTTYSYNPRGWLKSSTSDQFSLSLNYNEGTTPQYNGNIANQHWGAGASLPSTFTYEYDKLNRLQSGSRSDVIMSEALTYDHLGNIKTLSRDGGTAGVYNYTGNRLDGITNGPLATGTYYYDGNGNATTDGKNGMTLTYNILNLPSTANKSGVSVSYVYDAAGNKLSKTSTINGTTTYRYYIKGIESNGSVIDIIQTEEGVAQNSGGTYTYNYNLEDHLGNVRYTFDKFNGAIRRLQSDDYYAFGLRKSSGSPVSLDNKYLYNGKEIQDELEGQYDYGARFYDPVIARWTTVDPLADSFPWQSGYVSFDNNPINKIDPDGRAAYSPIYGTDGTLLGTDDQGLKGKAIVMDKDKFEQGMKHEDALKNNLGADGLESGKAKSDFLSSYNGLKDRPDYDGHVTLNEANKWFREGNGQPLYVDLAKIDLSAISQSNFSKVGERKYFQTLFNSDDGRVYGNIGLTLQAGGRVKGAYDDYDFDIKRYTNQTKMTPAELIIRNAATGIGHMRAGDGQGYRIHFNGTAPIKKK